MNSSDGGSSEERIVLELSRAQVAKVMRTANASGATERASAARQLPRLPDLIAGGRHDLADLAAAADANPDALGQLVRYLVRRGVFAETAPDRFELTDIGRLLCDGGPVGHRKVGKRESGGPGRHADALRRARCRAGQQHLYEVI